METAGKNVRMYCITNGERISLHMYTVYRIESLRLLKCDRSYESSLEGIFL